MINLAKNVLYSALFLPILCITFVATGFFLNLFVFGLVISNLSEQRATVVTQTSAPFLVWIGIAILVTGVLNIVKYTPQTTINKLRNNFSINWLYLLGIAKASFGIGMIWFYQFYAPNLP